MDYRPRKKISLQLKLLVINRIENGEKQSYVGRDLNLAASTIRSIFKNKDKVKEVCAKTLISLHKSRLTLPRSTLMIKTEKILNELLTNYVIHSENGNCGKKPVICLRTVQVKAQKIHENLKIIYNVNDTDLIDDFNTDRNWLERFKKRYILRQFVIKCDKGTSEDLEMHRDCEADSSDFLTDDEILKKIKREENKFKNKKNSGSTTENTEGNITGDLNKNEGDDENSILPMEVNLDDETEEPRDAQFNDTELDAEDPLNIDNTPTSTTVIETVPTPKIISTATVVNDDKPNEQKATGQNIHVRQNLTENPAPLPVVPVNPVRKRMQLKRPLPVSDILDGYNAKVSIEDEYKNYIDEDKAFLMSLLPAMKELTGPQKMEFKMTVLNELKRIRYPSSTPTPQTVGNLTVLPYAFQPIPNLANISHVIPIQQRTINPTTLQQVINKNSSTTQQTCKILSSQPPPLAAIIPQTVSATSAETAKQKQSPTVSSTATTAATVTAKPTPVEPPAKRASVSKDNNARSQPSATETKKTTSRRTPARRKPKKQAATNETQNNTEETQIITSDLTTPQDEEETRNDGELRTEIDLDEIKIEHIKVEPYDDEDTEDAMENC
ncbi:uncharacterized protein LOC142329169 isoform X6 [Lycorma delicatula]|uniref:uncharacterized protein LOC142329169 isoform X6 n=1 Tax=Lycorma delicatula TaxID=130591 RepID=UPI003F5156F1